MSISIRRAYLHFGAFQRISASSPRLPRNSVEQSIRYNTVSIVAAVKIGHVAPVVPPGTVETARTATMLEVPFDKVVVDVECWKAAAVVLEQRVAGEQVVMHRCGPVTFAVPSNVQSVAVRLVCDSEMLVIDRQRSVVPVGQTYAQWAVFLICQPMNNFIT